MHPIDLTTQIIARSHPSILRFTWEETHCTHRSMVREKEYRERNMSLKKYNKKKRARTTTPWPTLHPTHLRLASSRPDSGQSSQIWQTLAQWGPLTVDTTENRQRQQHGIQKTRVFSPPNHTTIIVGTAHKADLLLILAHLEDLVDIVAELHLIDRSTVVCVHNLSVTPPFITVGRKQGHLPCCQRTMTLRFSSTKTLILHKP